MSQALAIEEEEDDVALETSKRYTKGLLTPKQFAALECLMSRQPGETMESVSERAGIVRRTLYRYLEMPHFQEAYRKRVKSELSAHRVRVSTALVETATVVGMPGQTAAQKLYWQLIGDLKESIEVSGPDGQPISVQTSPALLSRLSVDLKRRIVEELEQIRKEDERLAREGESKQVGGEKEVEDDRERLLEGREDDRIAKRQVIEAESRLLPERREEGTE